MDIIVAQLVNKKFSSYGKSKTKNFVINKFPQNGVKWLQCITIEWSIDLKLQFVEYKYNQKITYLIKRSQLFMELDILPSLILIFAVFYSQSRSLNLTLTLRHQSNKLWHKCKQQNLVIMNIYVKKLKNIFKFDNKKRTIDSIRKLNTILKSDNLNTSSRLNSCM